MANGEITRSSTVLWPDPRRVLARLFVPGEWAAAAPSSRVGVVIDRVQGLSDHVAEDTLAAVAANFGTRHRHLDDLLRRHGAAISRSHGALGELSDTRLRLLGAYFTQEYAVEGAALTNPSMVPAPVDASQDDGDLAFVLSLRAIGEGHISSIVFRSGVLSATGDPRIDPAGTLLVGARRTEPVYDARAFGRQLVAAGADAGAVAAVMDHLSPQFTMEELESWLHAFTADRSLDPETHEMVRLVHWLASTNYVANFPADSQLRDRVLFPAGPTESRGMEDARFVRFTGDDGVACYYATYTAYDGFSVRPQLISTTDFASFRVLTIDGVEDHAKGMALFPRPVDGRFVALVRPDNESIAIATSDDVRSWPAEATVVWRPGAVPWDVIQTGNNGSPIETEAGWLVLTHGVGPMRRYVLGALLLDLDDPTRPLGYLPSALIEPSADERDGYVPNVVYSCGGLVHADRLVVPYGFSDRGTAIATFPLPAVLERLTTAGRALLRTTRST